MQQSVYVINTFYLIGYFISFIFNILIRILLVHIFCGKRVLTIYINQSSLLYNVSLKFMPSLRVNHKSESSMYYLKDDSRISNIEMYYKHVFNLIDKNNVLFFYFPLPLNKMNAGPFHDNTCT